MTWCKDVCNEQAVVNGFSQWSCSGPWHPRSMWTPSMHNRQWLSCVSYLGHSCLNACLCFLTPFWLNRITLNWLEGYSPFSISFTGCSEVFPFLFPRHSLNHLSRNRSNHLRRWQRRYTISEYGRDTVFRSCLSGALTCWCGCQLSLGRLAQGAAFLTHPRSRCLSNLLQWWSGS